MIGKKKQRDLYVSLRRKAIKQYFFSILIKRRVTDKTFWKTIEPIFPKKGCLQKRAALLVNDDKMVLVV